MYKYAGYKFDVSFCVICCNDAVVGKTLILNNRVRMVVWIW